MTSHRPIAVITGASAGIGAELARIAAADGFDPLLVARRRDRLERLAGELEDVHRVCPRIVDADLARPGSCERVLAAAGEAPIEILINNAGFGTYGPFAETPLERTEELLAVNVTALTRLTALVLPAMLGRGRGYIMNVASTAAFMPGPDMAVYYASKAYVLHFSEALREELRGSGVVVSALCPGPTRTEFHDVARMSDSPFMKRLWWMDGRRVAEIGYRALRRGRAVAIPGAMNRLSAWAPRFLPRLAVRQLVGAIQGRRAR